MPSFKDRFRSSRKSKKNKETASSTATDDSTTASGLCTNVSILSALTTADDHSGGVVLSNHQTYYSVEYCK